MIEIGQYATLSVIKKLEYGFILDGENLGELLLPNRHTPKDIEIDQDLDVFVYLDSEDRPIVTTQKPIATVG
jgi:hypothetical protein